MPKNVITALLLSVIVLAHSVTVRAQVLEGGFHTGASIIGADSPVGSEKDPEFGVWFLLWPFPDKHWAVCADWAYVPRQGYTSYENSLLLGESDRNRQYVDVTVQYYLKKGARTSFFVEAGGGALWNNSQIINPGGLTTFSPQGPQHVRRGVFTFGGGLRYRLIPHLSWVTEAKYHNPGREATGGRFMTGLVVGF